MKKSTKIKIFGCVLSIATAFVLYLISTIIWDYFDYHKNFKDFVKDKDSFSISFEEFEDLVNQNKKDNQVKMIEKNIFSKSGYTEKIKITYLKGKTGMKYTYFYGAASIKVDELFIANVFNFSKRKAFCGKERGFVLNGVPIIDERAFSFFCRTKICFSTFGDYLKYQKYLSRESKVYKKAKLKKIACENPIAKERLKNEILGECSD